ncbi:Down syndrome cell adhesion molecule-like protein Dscam2 [Dufourea novaeangliae]|uniref:Down syndrome cell adhesion molecule-like protein Dscam2 n=1 Tax=Dufourea novaeangliae TaxID=178035 RepID=A0A154P687_DUFNO|nr:Down syndrome cell adhesion molecule-like protein Dscam2 [Dufourea novaeangliae]
MADRILHGYAEATRIRSSPFSSEYANNYELPTFVTAVINSTVEQPSLGRDKGSATSEPSKDKQDNVAQPEVPSKSDSGLSKPGHENDGFPSELNPLISRGCINYENGAKPRIPLCETGELSNPASPRFNERVSPAPIRTGETIVLSCISQGLPPPMYLWFRESVSGTAMIFNSERIHARAGVLVLQSARAEDAGRYVCHANNTAGSERVELEVSIISSLSIHLAPQQTDKTTFDPPRSFEYKVRFKVGVSRYIEIGYEHRLERRPNGKCDGKTSQSVGKREKVVSMRRRLSTMVLGYIKEGNRDRRMVRVPSDAEFQCSVTGQPRPVITWSKDGLPVRESASGRSRITGNDGSTLHISSIARDDKGMYQCFAQNDYEMVQATAELRLGDAAPQLLHKFIEHTLQPGPSVSLKCVATGNPTPHFSWTLDGFPLPQNDRYEDYGFMIGQYVTVHGEVISHVNISVVHVEDGGQYRCTASNRVARVHHSAPLNIYGLPHVRPMGNYAAVAGETTVIKCPVAGFPITSIVWDKDGKILPTSRRQEVWSNGTLVLYDVDSTTDRGAYTCTAKNAQGRSDSQTVHIEVKVPPKIDPFSFPNNTQEGQRLHVTCAVREGDSPLKITWLKDGRPVEPSEATTHHIGDFYLALKIPSASTAHNGNYTCVASNDAAETSRTAALLVHGNSVRPSRMGVILCQISKIVIVHGQITRTETVSDQIRGVRTTPRQVE